MVSEKPGGVPGVSLKLLQILQIFNNIFPEGPFIFDGFYYLFMFKMRKLSVNIFHFCRIIGINSYAVLSADIGFVIRHMKSFRVKNPFICLIRDCASLMGRISLLRAVMPGAAGIGIILLQE
jgi:hypothetical protein